MSKLEASWAVSYIKTQLMPMLEMKLEQASGVGTFPSEGQLTSINQTLDDIMDTVDAAIAELYKNE